MICDAEIAEHDRLQARMADLARHPQRLLELPASLGQIALHLMQQAKVGERVAFPVPIAELPCTGETGLKMRPRLRRWP